MQDMTDCFKFGNIINQYKQLCSSVSPATSTSSLDERNYSDIEQYEEETIDDETEIEELNFENQDTDFRKDHSAAHESFRTKTTDQPILKKPIFFELIPHMDTIDLIQKISDFSRKAHLDIQTLLEEQLKDPVLLGVCKWIQTPDTKPQKTPDNNQSKALIPYYNKFEHDTKFLCY